MENHKQKFKKDFKKRIYKFTVDLIKFIKQLPSSNTCKTMSNQLMCSGTSIGANYIEANGSSSKKDFTNFLHYSLKSANESLFWLSLIKDTEKCDKQAVIYLMNELSEISKIIAASILTIKGKRNI